MYNGIVPDVIYGEVENKIKLSRLQKEKNLLVTSEHLVNCLSFPGGD